MGIDVGIARIQYGHAPPRGVVYEFTRFLIHHNHDADWRLASEENVLVEYSQDSMRRMVERYAEAQGLGEDERSMVLRWAFGLPWNNDTETVMLHMSW